MKSAGIRLFFLYALRFVKQRWFTFLLLGLLLFLSSMLYSSVDHSAGAIDEESQAFFEETNQEDFYVDVSQQLTGYEQSVVHNRCGIETTELSTLYHEDRTCYEEVVDSRRDALADAFEGAHFEARHYLDLTFDADQETHRMRVLEDAETINRSLIEQGRAPEGEAELAINRNYATANDLAIGDTLTLRGETFEITGFVLFPDYNLPIFDYPLLLDSTAQTLALMEIEGRDRLEQAPSLYFAGDAGEVPIEDHEASITPFLFLQYPFFNDFVPTENNLRSGAIYAEIEASQEFALFMSLFIGGIGFIILMMLLVRTIRNSRQSFGVLKALGVDAPAIVLPLLAVISVFAFVFLLAGYLAGYFLADPIQDVFLSFYLLPRGEITPGAAPFAFAVLLPLALLLLLVIGVLFRQLRPRPVELIRPPIIEGRSRVARPFRRLTAKLPFLSRMQLAFIIRHPGKFLIFFIGVLAAVFSGLLSLGLFGVFEDTLPAYYEGTDLKAKGYSETMQVDAPTTGERAIELDVRIADDRAELIGLDEEQSLHPLRDLDGEDLRGRLIDGLVISESFKDLTGYEVGEEVRLRIADQTLDVEIVGVADVYAGEHVFYDRARIAEWLGVDTESYNVTYADASLDEDEYAHVLYIDDILAHVENIHDIFNVFLYLFVGAALAIGMIVVYLLTLMSVEDHYHPLALFKVLGYDDKDIRTILLGGYLKAALAAFLVAIPISTWAFGVLRTWFMQMYNFTIPLALDIWDVALFAVLFVVMLVLGMFSARRRINRMSLQQALTLYQQ